MNFLSQKSSESDSYSKIGHGFSNKVVQKLKLSINYFLQKCTPKLLFFIEKKIRQIRMVFDFENSLSGQKPCFSEPKQLARQKVKNQYNSYDFSKL